LPDNSIYRLNKTDKNNITTAIGEFRGLFEKSQGSMSRFFELVGERIRSQDDIPKSSQYAALSFMFAQRFIADGHGIGKGEYAFQQILELVDIAATTSGLKGFVSVTEKGVEFRALFLAGKPECRE